MDLILGIVITIAIIFLVKKNNDNQSKNNCTYKNENSPLNYRGGDCSLMGADGLPADCCERCKYADVIRGTDEAYCQRYDCICKQECVCDDFRDAAIAMLAESFRNK